MTTTTMTPEEGNDSRRARRILARVGAAGFVFFLFKGLLWILVPAALWAIGN